MPQKVTQDIKQNIETLVRDRNTHLAKAKIKDYLRQQKSSDQAVFEACEWFRRLGLYQEGLKLVLKKNPFEGKVSTKESLGQRLLWAATLLNQLGASFYAYQLLYYLEIDSLSAYKQAGDICLGNYDFNQSLNYFSRFISLSEDKSLYSFRIGSLGYSDSLVMLGEYDKAIDWVKGILDQSSEPLLKGICLQACGEYYAQKEDYKLALSYFEKAEKKFPAGDTSPDYSFLIKWKAYVLCRLNKKSQGIELFKKAVHLQKKMKIREEALFSTYILMYKVGLLSPKLEKLMLNHPGLSSFFRARLPQTKESTEWGSEEAEIQIDLSSKEYKLNNQWYLDLPKEIELLAYIRIVEDAGLNYLKAMSTLWPEEAFSFQILPQRLSQLIYRLNHQYGLSVKFKNNFIFLDSKDRAQVYVLTQAQELPRFLRQQQKSFTRHEVSDFYKLSKTNSVVQLNKWLQKKWIQPEGKARALKYLKKEKV